MTISKLLTVALSAGLLTLGSAHAADDHPGHHADVDMTRTEGHSGHEGMHHQCMRHDMGGGMMSRMIAVPQLPPGNAKLQMQMQAEIMQKVGEVLAKYAEQVKEPLPPH